MSEWAAKRFWKATAAVAVDGGYRIELDGRPVRTPAKTPLVLPSAGLAEAVAMEWDAQSEVIDPLTMPFTRGANAAIDKVATQKAEVIEMLAAYGDSDLLCYRAAGPDGLIAQQRATWDPLLDWAEGAIGVRLQTAEGVMHVPQDAQMLARLKAELDPMSVFALAGMHDLISISGSLIIALAVVKKHVTAERGWAVSRVDEEWQFSQWGEDADARMQEKVKYDAFLQAARFYELSGS